MTGFLAHRLGQTLFVLLGVSLIVFGMLHVIPGNPVDVIFAGEKVTADQREALRQQLGLDRPLPAQYAQFVTDAVRGDLGMSVRRQVPVGAMIATALPSTLELLIAAVLFAVIVAVPVAVLSSLRPGTVWDRLGSTGALFGISLPSFRLGIMLILVFAVSLGWLPPTGRVGTGLRVLPVTGFMLVDTLLAADMAALRSALPQLILPASAHDYYPDWDGAANVTVALLRAEAGRDPHNTDLRQLVGELSTLSDEFRDGWAAHNVRIHHAGNKQFNHPDVGLLDLVRRTMTPRADTATEHTR